MTKEDERYIVLEFQKHYSAFPLGEIKFGDKPDCIIVGDQKIGIEVSQVYKDQDHQSGSLIKARQTFYRNLSSNILERLSISSFPKCVFNIILNEDAYTKKLSSRQIADVCFSEILSIKNQLSGFGFFEFENSGTLPEIIKGYSIYINHDIAETSFAESGGMVGIPLTNSYVQFIIDKKERIKDQFEKCDFYYLLIKEGSGEADYFGVNVIKIENLKTSFDKVFIFRHRNNEILELR